MTLKQVTTLIVLLAIPSSLLSMNLALQRLTTWPEQVYHNAYQGAQKYYSFGKEKYERAVACAMTATKEQADQEQWPEEFRVVCDWIYALKKTEEVYLSQPYTPWTIEDLKTISSWLTRLTTNEPGALRKKRALWATRSLTKEEVALANLIMDKENLQQSPPYEEFVNATSEECKANWLNLVTRASPKVQESVDECPPNFQSYINRMGIPNYLSRPIDENEKSFLKANYIIFPEPGDIEHHLSMYIEFHNRMCLLHEIKPILKRKELVRQFGARCHFWLVRIHPFSEGSKRLGRLCMNIKRMQHSIEPIIIANASDYRRSLMISLRRDDSDPFVNYIMRIPTSRHDATKHALPQPEQKTRSCAQCNKDNAPQRCSRCKAVNYCDRECQTQHWKSHKKNCQK